MNNAFRDQLSNAGLVISGISPDRQLVEFVELPRDTHPFFVATQAHPELKSRPTRAHPLFAAFVDAALRHGAAGRLEFDHTPGVPGAAGAATAGASNGHTGETVTP